MKKRLIWILIAFLVLSALPPLALAKSPTVKMTVSGGELPSAIEITDPQVLGISSIWGGQFLDSTRGVLKEPPRELPTYEIWFYIQVSDKSIKKRYVVYYSPDASPGQGYVYLPGEGQPWYWLNVSAMLRQGRDGKWSYASPAWEELLKPMIARGQVVDAKR